MNNRSNIELYHNNLTLSKIVPDESILEHCTIQYKYYIDKGAIKGWRVYNYRCNYCNNTVRGSLRFASHLKICEGLKDDYVPKPKRRIK